MENLEKVLALYAKTEARVDAHQKFVERVAEAIGRPGAVYVVLVVVVAWILFNALARVFGGPVVDPPPFPWLCGVVDLAALLATMIVLTTQRRQGRHAEHRAFLDLQVNMLAERKVAKLIALVEELRRDLPNVRDRRDPVAEAMTHAVNPELVISAIEEGVVGQDASTTEAEKTPGGT